MQSIVNISEESDRQSDREEVIQNSIKELEVTAVVNGYHIMDKNESDCLI